DRPGGTRHVDSRRGAADGDAAQGRAMDVAGRVGDQPGIVTTSGQRGPPDYCSAPAAGHEARQLEQLSVGTREQLATLLRLAIAGYLHTAVVLDDQLVHSDSERLGWFSERLCG